MDEGGHELGSGRAERVAEGNGAAVDVEPLRIGIELLEPYVGPEGVLTGTARLMQEERELAASRARHAEKLRAERLLERKHALLEQRIAELRAEFAAEEVELLALARSASEQEDDLLASRGRLGRLRGANGSGREASPRNGRPASLGKVLRAKRKEN